MNRKLVTRENFIAIAIAISCFIGGIFLANIHTDQLPKQVTDTVQTDIKNLIGQPLPNFSLSDTSGQLHHSSEWAGNVLVINFWATWCPPCKEEIPHFIDLQKKYGQQGLQFLGITMDPVDKVRDFSNRFDINYPLLIGQHDIIMLAQEFGNHTGGLPYTVIIDRNGNISFIRQGLLPISDAESVIKALF